MVFRWVGHLCTWSVPRSWVHPCIGSTSKARSAEVDKVGGKAVGWTSAEVATDGRNNQPALENQQSGRLSSKRMAFPCPRLCKPSRLKQESGLVVTILTDTVLSHEPVSMVHGGEKDESGTLRMWLEHPCKHELIEAFVRRPSW